MRRTAYRQPSRCPQAFRSSANLGPAEPSFFAADGFHASPAGYERWAQAICDHLDL